jgi:hypothetical protein
LIDFDEMFVLSKGTAENIRLIDTSMVTLLKAVHMFSYLKAE